jgi:hypothetical protein
MSDKIMELKTVQTGAFKTLIEAMKEILTDANIEFTDNDGNNAMLLSEKNGYNDINVYLQIQVFNRLFF